MNTLQRFPILEPGHVPLARNADERLIDEILNLFSGLRCEVAGWIFICYGAGWELEFRPDDEMYDPRVDTVWPVVVEDPDVI